MQTQEDVTKHRRWALVLLLAISTCAFIDRAILNTVGQAIKDDLHISDLQLGLLGGIAFSLLYGILGVPIARLSERRNRVRIISIAVAVWSAMTVLCGFASTFGHLLLARIGVGIGEAGANAPTQSLLADYYPPHKRATIVSILGLATPIGIVIGGIGGAYAAEIFGWRSAFLLVGFPGLLLAIVAWFTIREPVRGASEGKPQTSVDVPPLMDVVRHLAASKGFRHILIAAVITNFIGFSVVSFEHPFFVRAFKLSYTEAAFAFAAMNSISVTGGYLIGGMLTDKLILRDLRYYGWLPGICMFVAAPLYAFGFLQTNWTFAIILLTLPGLFSATYFAPTYAITQNLVGPRMRASAVALVSLALNLVGMAFGPVVTGALSDMFAARHFGAADYLGQCSTALPALAQSCAEASTYGIRMALVAVVMLFFWSGTHFLLSASHLKRELADVQPS